MIRTNASHAQTTAFNKLHDYFIGPLIAQQGLYSSLRSAYHKTRRQSLCVKIISKKAMEGLPKKERILFNETILGPLLSHKNLMRPVEIIENESRIFQFMPYAENGDLLQIMRSVKLEQSVVISFANQLLCAIEKLHSLGIVHRDIKLENLFVTGNNILKLGDFGLCSLTSDGIMTDNCGSFEYTAPEAVKEHSFDGFKADLWGVGVVLFTLFSKRLPFENVTLDYDYSKELDFSAIPEPYQGICRSLLDLNPENRPNAYEIRNMLGYKDSKKVLSAINLTDDDINMFTISKLSQAIGLPVNEIKSDLESDEFSELKVLAVLIHDKSNIFMPSCKAVTAPLRPQAQIFSKRFQTDCFHVITLIKNYLLPLKCAVSSPLSNSPEIVLNGKHEDKRLSYSLSDDSNGFCSVELSPDENSVDMCKSVFRHLERAFATSSE